MHSYYFLYLHGYQGSPNSIKANKLKTWLNKTYDNVHIDAPKLEMHAESALLDIHTRLDNVKADKKVIIGSSLGGFMAHLFKQLRHDVDQVILINPATRLDLIVDLPAYQEVSEDAKALLSLMPTQITSLEDYLLLLQEDDVVTPAAFAVDGFNGAHIDIKTGQGHHYDNIEVSFEVIESFLNKVPV